MYATSSSFQSCEKSLNGISHGMTRNSRSSSGLHPRKQSQGLTKSHQDFRNHSWCGLSVNNVGMPTVDAPTSNATWSVDDDSSRRRGLRRMGSNRLVNMVTGGSTLETEGMRRPSLGGRLRRGSLLSGQKSLSRRNLTCVPDDEGDKQDARSSSRRVMELLKHELVLGSEEIVEKVRKLIEVNNEQARKSSLAVELQLQLAVARQLSGNTIGALIAMKKMKRIGTEHKKYVKVVDYVRSEEINMARLQEQTDQDHSAWIALIERVTEEVDTILSVSEQEGCWSNEVLLEELLSSMQDPAIL